MTDEALMDRYLACDDTAFVPLETRYRGPLTRFFLRHTGNRADAEDLTQQVFVKLVMLKWKPATEESPPGGKA